MIKNKISAISIGVMVLISGVTLGAISTSVSADNKTILKQNNVIIEETPSVKIVSFLEAVEPEIKETDAQSIVSYVNYNKEKITEVIKLYAILENCQFQNTQKDEFIYYLSEYVTSAVQSNKYTTQDLKEQYISFAQSFQPPHPTQDDCIETYNDAKETVHYWNEKKNTAFNELFAPAKNRYSPDPEDNIDIIQETIQLPSQNAAEKGKDNNVYSLATHTKKLPWIINTNEIFQLQLSNDSENKSTSVENEKISEIIPDNEQNVNKMAVISDQTTKNTDNVKKKTEHESMPKKIDHKQENK